MIMITFTCFTGIDQPIFNSTTPLVLEEGTSVTISCSSVAYRIDTFKWETHAGIIVSNSSYLRFSPINRTDDNVYRCIGINSAGTKKSSNLTITVQCNLLNLILLSCICFHPYYRYHLASSRLCSLFYATFSYLAS